MRILILVIVVISHFPVIGATQLNVGYNDVRPHFFFDDSVGAVSGPAMSMFSELSRILNVKFKYTHIPMNRMTQSIVDGSIDLNFASVRTEERLKEMKFSTEPIATNIVYGFVVLGHSKLNRAKILSRKKLEICLEKDNYYPIKMLKKHRLNNVHGEFNVQERLIQLLKDNRCEVVFTATPSGLVQLAKMVEPNLKLRVVKEPLTVQNLYVGFGPHVSDKLIRSFDKAIIELKNKNKDYLFFYREYYKINE